MSQQPPANLPDKPPGEWGTEGQGDSESAPKSWSPLVESFQEAVPPQEVHYCNSCKQPMNELTWRISQPLGSETKPLVDRLISAGDNLLNEHAQETDHFVIAIREYQAAIRELLKCP